MSGRTFLLDTNIIIPFLNGDIHIIEKVQVSPIVIPIISVGELYYGLEKSQQKEKNKEVIEGFLADSKLIDLSLRTTEIYGIVKNQLKNNGTPIPENDIWIAAIALEFEYVLVSRDSHFNFIGGLAIEKW